MQSAGIHYKPPNVTTLLACGSTANIWKHSTRPYVIIKTPVDCGLNARELEELHNKFYTETQIFERLGEHQNIVRCETELPS